MESMTFRKKSANQKNVAVTYVKKPFVQLATWCPCQLPCHMPAAWPAQSIRPLYSDACLSICLQQNITTQMQSILLSPLCREKSENLMPTWSCSRVRPLWFPALCLPPLWASQPPRHLLTIWAGQPVLTKWFCSSWLPKAKNGWKFG